MDLHPVGGGEDHRFRIHHVLQRKVRREGVRSEGARLTAGLDHRLERAAPVTPEEGDASLDGHRQRFDARPGSQGFGSRSRREAPEVAAVDVVLVGSGDEAPLPVADRVLDLEGARGERFGFAAGGGNGVVVPVAGALPGKEDAGVVRPVELVGGGGAGEDAPHPLGRPKDLAGAARHAVGVELHHLDAPGRTLPLGDEQEALEHRRLPDEGDRGAVGGEGRRAVAVHRRIQVVDGLRAEVVDPDEGVRSPGGDERQSATVRGEAQVPERAPAVDELLGFRVRFEPHLPDPAPADEQDRVPIGSEEGRGGWRGDAAGFRPFDHPKRLLHSRRIARRVRQFTRPVGAVAADEGEAVPVAAEREAVDGRPVVAFERGQAASREPGGFGRPHVARAPLVEHPGDPGAVGRRGEARRERGRKDRLEGELGLGAGGAEDGKPEKDRDASHGRTPTGASTAPAGA